MLSNGLGLSKDEFFLKKNISLFSIDSLTFFLVEGVAAMGVKGDSSGVGVWQIDFFFLLRSEAAVLVRLGDGDTAPVSSEGKATS